jgi:dipeptidyl aminopeptidase/acylaminoacyl peptidase
MASDIAPSTAPYGSWRSPVTAASLTAETVGLSFPVVDGDDVFWLEGRPGEAGRVVLVRRTPDGATHDVTPAPYNVRSRVHEYGGGAFDVVNGVVVFCHYVDGRVYVLDLDEAGESPAPVAITPAGALRYGDLRIDLPRRAVYAVCEDHGSGAGEVANRLVCLDLDSDNAEGGLVLVEGHDFVASAVPSPDGAQLAWVQWDHPNMPWDASELLVADIAPDGTLLSPRTVAGGPAESVSQPRWAADGLLLFISDRTGWWNLYACAVRPQPAEPFPLWPEGADFAGPDWMLGTSSYGISRSGKLVCTWTVDGYARLGILDLASGGRTPLRSDLTAVGHISVRGNTALLIGGYADLPGALLRMDVEDPDQVEVIRRVGPVSLEPEWVSLPEPTTWEGPGGDQVHGFYYPPRNPGFVAPDGERPPLLVLSHGGPTGMSTPAFAASLQYWTSRGFAVLHVNYGGSSGYGRAYRERLRGQWGVVDVDDCVSGALAMAERGLADPDRLAIRGGSAGGYTTLAALAFRDVFKAGASLFGVGDLETLARDTHKFESRYLDGLVGPYPAARELYQERSPIHHVDSIRCPIILLQGADDPVVPRGQAEQMADAVRAKGLPVALLVFEGEGHGFRRAENVIRAVEAEAYFYGKVFGFTLADHVEPVDIDNL